MKSKNEDFKICPYFFNYQTAATLMIDDLAPVAISSNKTFQCFNDHGGLMDNPNGLFYYFEKLFLTKYPEVKGTFFILIEDHFKWSQASGNYNIKSQGFDDHYVKFLESLTPRFDFAFHGTSHGKVESNKMFQEFSYRKVADIDELNSKINLFNKNTGISFSGGKFPAYQSNSQSEDILKGLGFRWWAFHKEMKNKKHPENDLFFKQSGIISFPTNFSGENFRYFFDKNGGVKNKLKFYYHKLKKIQLELHLTYLYQKRKVISIQEHFTTLRTNGTFQRPNVFTDLKSLEIIFDHLRGADIWYATCNEISDYFKSYKNASLIENAEKIEISNKQRGEFLFPISISSPKCSELINDKGERFIGKRKNGNWIFNHLQPGTYKKSKHQNYPQ